MKKLLALVLAMVMTMALVACGGDKNDSQPPADDQTQTDTQTPETPEEPASAGELTLWTYPIGDWGKEEKVKAITDAFTADTGIAVKVEYLAYADGDDKVNSAITAKSAPARVGSEERRANRLRVFPHPAVFSHHH